MLVENKRSIKILGYIKRFFAWGQHSFGLLESGRRFCHRRRRHPIWRQVDVSEGRKIPSGICILIFCSLIGGILTICISEADLYGCQGYMASKVFDEEGKKKELSKDEKIELIAKYKKPLDEGTIAQEDFEAKRKDLLQ